MDELKNNPFKVLEGEGEVPAYLKKALVSEIDFIRDLMQIVSVFGNVYFDTALKVLATSEEVNEDPKEGN